MTKEVSHVTQLVIIGGGSSGARLAKLFYEHPEYNIATTLISTSKKHLHTPAAVRLCVQPELYDDFTLDLENLYAEKHTKTLQAHKDIPRVTFISGHVKAVSTVDKFVTYVDLYNPQSGNEIESITKFDVLVLATGSRQSSPLWGFSTTDTYTLETMQKTAQDVAKAKRVAVLGAGATGVEAAAEIVEKHPHLKSNLVLYAGTQLPMADTFDEKRSKLIVARLGKMGVQVLQERGEVVEEDNQFKIKNAKGEYSEPFDVVINAAGAKPSLDYIKSTDPLGQALDQKGALQTDEYLRVIPFVYAMGDVFAGSDLSWPGARGTADVVFQTILVDLKLKPTSALIKYEGKLWRKTKMVTLGKSDGVGKLFDWSLPACAISFLKGQDFHVDGFKGVKPQ